MRCFGQKPLVFDLLKDVMNVVRLDYDGCFVCLNAMQTFHDELYAKRETVDRTLARCRRMLQESPSEEHASVDVDIQLTMIREQFDALCQRSDRRHVSSVHFYALLYCIFCSQFTCNLNDDTLFCTEHMLQVICTILATRDNRKWFC